MFEQLWFFKKYIQGELGANTRLDPVQAAILSVKLKYLSSWNKRRHQIADTYFRELADYLLNFLCW